MDTLISNGYSEVYRELSGEYRVEKDVGSGGSSYVMGGFRKRDERQVAIKVLSLPTNLARSESELAKKRFYREARLIASLKCPYIVECIDYGLFNGEPCMILEFIEGKSLGEYLKAVGPQPFDISVEIAIQILRALETAHKSGIIH